MTAQAMQGGRTGLPWWLVLIEGIALVVLGILWFTSPGMTTIVAVTFLGWYWLIAGIFEIVGIFIDRTMWGWKLFSGILGVIAGIVVVRHPLWAPFILGGVLIIFLGVEGLIIGGVRIYQAFKGAGWGSGILGAISILFGIVLLANVGIATLALPWALGTLAFVGGIVAIVTAFRLR